MGNMDMDTVQEISKKEAKEKNSKRRLANLKRIIIFLSIPGWIGYLIASSRDGWSVMLDDHSEFSVGELLCGFFATWVTFLMVFMIAYGRGLHEIL